MNRLKYKFIFAVLAFSIYQASQLIGVWYELTAPKMELTEITQSEYSMDDQRKSLVEFESKICQAITPCANATMTSNLGLIEANCSGSITALQELEMPRELPRSIIRNLTIYRQSLINTETRTLNQWRSLNKVRKSFATSFFKNWEIDTCGYASIPQKMRRLYSLDELSKSRIITCKEIESLKSLLSIKRSTANEK